VWPIFTLAYVGYDVLAPFVAYGVEGGLRYSDQSTIDARLQASSKISATNSQSSTSGRKPRSIEWPTGGLMAGLGQTLQSIRLLSATAKILNWSNNGCHHKIITSARNGIG
jgi:hypothetical protein